MSTSEILPLLQSYLSTAFPERENPRASELNCLNSGWESDVYSFRIEWGTAASPQVEDLILRIYPGEDADRKSSEEFRNLRMLRQLGYPVPRVDRLESRPGSPFGKPFLIMERIDGQSLWKPMFHGFPWKQKKLLRLFCGLYTSLHALDWRPLVSNPAEFEPGGPYDVVDRQMARWVRIGSTMPMPGFMAVFDWLQSHKHDSPSSRAAIVHWDYHPNNILLKKNGDGVVIDWTQLDLTDYRFDLSWTLVLVSSYEGQAWYDRMLREYERQAGHPVEGLDFFIAAACFRRLFSIIGSLAYGAEKLGMRPGAEEVMRQQARPLKQVYERMRPITHLAIPEVEHFLSEAA